MGIFFIIIAFKWKKLYSMIFQKSYFKVYSHNNLSFALI